MFDVVYLRILDMLIDKGMFWRQRVNQQSHRAPAVSPVHSAQCFSLVLLLLYTTTSTNHNHNE